jgi:hypothetical protein
VATFSHTASRPRTALAKLSARQASAVAFRAPADVPQMMSNGVRPGLIPASCRMRRIACSTPAW